MSYFRAEIEKMSGYTPGEQPKVENLIKLNTNENPYPPSPKALAVLKGFARDLRLYPDPVATQVLEAAARFLGVSENQVMAGNGSDDILTIAIRACVGQGEKIAFPSPSYSLYPVLSDIQGATKVAIHLTDDFQLPADILEQLQGCKLFVVPNPNAPTGNLFCRETLRMVCENFDGIVLIDEAYADFAEENCIDFIADFGNVLVSRTLSKSFSLAGIRLGFVAGRSELIAELVKVKDSYNVNALTQAVGAAALNDLDYMRENRARVIASRVHVTQQLMEMGMTVLPSAANFIFVKPNVIEASDYFAQLRTHKVITRYFPATRTRAYLRITIGTEEQMARFLEVTREILN